MAVASVCVIIAIYAVRFLFLRTIQGSDLKPMTWIAPRGLITVLLFYNIPEQYQSEFFDPGVLFFVILASSIIMMVSMMAGGKKVDVSGTVQHINPNILPPAAPGEIPGEPQQG